MLTVVRMCFFSYTSRPTTRGTRICLMCFYLSIDSVQAADADDTVEFSLDAPPATFTPKLNRRAFPPVKGIRLQRKRTAWQVWYPGAHDPESEQWSWAGARASRLWVEADVALAVRLLPLLSLPKGSAHFDDPSPTLWHHPPQLASVFMFGAQRLKWTPNPSTATRPKVLHVSRIPHTKGINPRNAPAPQHTGLCFCGGIYIYICRQPTC